MSQKRKLKQNTDLPARLASKIASDDAARTSTGDDGRFKKRFKNGAASRKQARKQAREEKKQRKNISHKRAHGHALPAPPAAKRKAAAPSVKTNSASRDRTTATPSAKPAAVKRVITEAEERERLMRFAKRNQGMYQLLRESNLVDNVDKEAGIVNARNSAEDLEDRELRRLERNLGIKSNSKLASAFYDEGLGELFDGISFGSKDVQQKSQDPGSPRAKSGVQANVIDPEPGSEQDPELELESVSGSEADTNDEDIGSDSDDDIDSDDDGSNIDDSIDNDSEDDDMFGLDDFGSEEGDDGSESEDSDIAEMYKSQGIDFKPELTGDYSDSDGDSCSADSDSDDFDEGTAEVAPLSGKVPTGPTAPVTDSAEPSTSKYVPPSLRRKLAEEAGQEDERVVAIRKALQGQLNRLSEANIDGIITQIEAQYAKYPRHHVNDVLTDLILQAIRSRIHMLDTFLYVNAALVGAVHRAVGLEPVAFLVQRLMEEFETFFKRGALDAHGSGKAQQPAGEVEALTPGKECQNLCVFLAELYNFQVISCQLVYDVIRMCIEDINEFTAELLLKIIRISGVQLRKDDPLALKEIVQQVNETVGKAGAKKLSVRCQFMVESLTNLKDNRMRNTMSASADSVAKLKKFLGNMDKRRSVASVEPINIGLQDIREVDTKGKWWLVGASWVGNQYDPENEGSSAGAQEAMRRMQEETGNSEMERLLKLAREQHMNTDVRRSIFITLLSSDDYADAFERLLKLDLKKTQVREAVRVLLHCCGQESAYNPYYTLVAFKMCNYHSSYRLTLQYALWDFLRETGEVDVGGLGRIASEDSSSTGNVPLRRIVNTAKLYAWLIDKQALSLLILKTVTFAKVGPQARIFFQVVFSSIFLQHRKQTEKDTQSLYETFGKATANPTLCHGILFFFHHFVKRCELVEEAERPIMKWGCKIVKQVFRSSAGGNDMSMDF
ncbi:suppressor of glycerol defect [Coemansia sp. RSA 2050]|nr:suppressor of glycerol defect [Coemansia sp. RSA 2050]KAJ2735407.1 suppressor of glycerol defect [Coemansia sp. BCRC 34962]